MFEGNKSYSNRYGETYEFVKQSATRYKFVMRAAALDFCRYGGKDGQHGIDIGDLGMFDPSGGPYVTLGVKIDGKRIVKIASCDQGFMIEVAK